MKDSSERAKKLISELGRLVMVLCSALGHFQLFAAAESMALNVKVSNRDWSRGEMLLLTALICFEMLAFGYYRGA